MYLGDPIYGAILDRVRVGSPTSEDITKLKERCISSDGCASLDQQMEKFMEMLRRDKEAVQKGEIKPCVCLVPLVEMADEFNDEVMKRENIDVVDIPMVLTDERLSTSKNKKKKKKEFSKKHLKKNETAGFEQVLRLGVGARVMLRRNMSYKKGLINGSIGVVSQVNKVGGVVDAILVNFPHLPETVEIKRVCGDYSIAQNVFVRCQQFALSLAYALTIHKVCYVVEVLIGENGDETFAKV